jgi:hypothetical protein
VSIAQLRTLAAGTSANWKYLGRYGQVAGVKYSYTVPGGCEQLSCTLGAPAALRVAALDPGRIVQAVLGASIVWEGTLDEPAPSDAGWSITAQGSGTWGSLYNADYSAPWNIDAPDNVITNAIGRGLGWLPTSIGAPAGMYFGQPPDSGSIKIDAMLNQMCEPGGLVWQVKRGSWGNSVRVDPIPATPTRLLVCTSPVPRTLGGDINAIEIRYQATPDLGPGAAATFATTYATDAASIAKHGRREEYMDLSSNGVMLGTDAQAVGNGVLANYTRASYAGPFTVRYGELLTIGGQLCDLASYWHANEGPMVCKLLLADQGYGGEVTPGPVVFVTGRYEYDQDAQQATITPYQTASEDFASLLASRAAAARGRRVIVKREKHGELWWLAGTHKKHWRAYPHKRKKHHKPAGK